MNMMPTYSCSTEYSSFGKMPIYSWIFKFKYNAHLFLSCPVHEYWSLNMMPTYDEDGEMLEGAWADGYGYRVHCCGLSQVNL